MEDLIFNHNFHMSGVCESSASIGDIEGECEWGSFIGKAERIFSELGPLRGTYIELSMSARFGGFVIQKQM